MFMEKVGNAANSLAAKILLGFIGVTFVLSGVAGYVFTRGDNFAAKVNGEEISQPLFQQRYNEAYQQYSQRLGAQFAAIADTPDFNKNLRNEVLQQLINQTLLNQYAKDLNLNISKKQVEVAIVSSPEFKKDGKFNNDFYLQTLELNGLTPDYYAMLVGSNLRMNQLQQGILGTSFTLPAMTNDVAKEINQTRTVRISPLEMEAFLKKVSVTDEEVKAFYEQNLAMFAMPESAKVQYIDLNADIVKSRVAVSDEEINQYYQDNKAQFLQQHLAHIQVADEALAKQIHQELQQGAAFVELAKQYSKDALSAKNGGDLSWVTAGMMPANFEMAAQQLNKGAFSAPVAVDGNFHLIKVLDEKVQPLSEIKEDIATKLRKEKLNTEFYALEKSLSEKAFETPESLEAVAKALDLKVEETENFTRQSVPEALNFANIVSTIFDSDITQGGINSEAINVDAQHSLVVRVMNYQPSRTKALDEVKNEIANRLTRQKAQDLALAQAKIDAEKLNKGERLPVSFEFNDEETHSFGDRQALTDDIFALPKPQDHATYHVVKTPGLGVAIVEFIKAEMPELSKEELQYFQQGMQMSEQQQLSRMMLDALRRQADIQINPTLLEDDSE